MKNDIKHILFHLDDWVKADKVGSELRTDILHIRIFMINILIITSEQPSKSFVNLMDDVQIYNDPFGVVLVIGAWNYPLQLLLVPVASAIAAGNCVVIKPSEIAANCAKFIADVIPKYLDNVRLTWFSLQGTKLLKQISTFCSFCFLVLVLKLSYFILSIASMHICIFPFCIRFLCK